MTSEGEEERMTAVGPEKTHRFHPKSDQLRLHSGDWLPCSISLTTEHLHSHKT